jgi:heme/copper-type cytochrome/quinol oxidase subunit 3
MTSASPGAPRLRTLWLRRRAVGLGALTLWPLIFVAMSPWLAGSGSAAGARAAWAAAALPTALLVPGLVVFYVRHATRNWNVPRRRRPWWAAALVLGALVVMPVYWWRHVWRAHG